MHEKGRSPQGNAAGPIGGKGAKERGSHYSGSFMMYGLRVRRRKITETGEAGIGSRFGTA